MRIQSNLELKERPLESGACCDLEEEARPIMRRAVLGPPRRRAGAVARATLRASWASGSSQTAVEGIQQRQQLGLHHKAGRRLRKSFTRLQPLAMTSDWSGGGLSTAASAANLSSGVDKSGLERYKPILKLLGYYSEEANNIRRGAALYRSCEEQAMLLAIDPSFGLQMDWFDNNNFHSRQQMIMLHVWMVHKRLLAEEESGKEIQENLFDACWEYTTRRIRSTGVHELTVNKHLAEIQKTCFAAAVSYDHGINITNDENLELGSALWRNVYLHNEKIPDEQVYKLADYVRNQVSTFGRTGSESVLDATLPWLKLAPDVSSVRTKWRRDLSADGRTYWWNAETRESQWDPPPEVN